MPRLPRYERQAVLQVQPTDTGLADTSRQLAAMAGDFSSRAAQLLGQVSARKGAEAGAQSTGEPKYRSEFTASGRAFNDAAQRNYLIEQYSDIEQNLGRIEAESRNNPLEYQAAADGMRKGLIQGAPARARAEIMTMFTRRYAEGMVRVQEGARESQRLENRAILQKGLDQVTDSISRRLSSGSPMEIQTAENEQLVFGAMIDGAVASGDLAPHEAVAMKAAAEKQITMQVINGQFEATLDKPDGKPAAFIQQIMDMPVETLSDEEKQSVIGGLFQRLNRFQAAHAEATQLEDVARKGRWDKGEREATLAMLQRNLTLKQLSTMVANDEIDPAVARTLENGLLAAKTSVDDPKTKFLVETNLLHYSESDIAGMGNLSLETRSGLILQRRKDAEGWKGDQGAQEATRRIDVALGIPSGLGPQFAVSITPEKATAAAKARSYFYDLVEATPEEQRKAKYFELADKAITEVGKESKAIELQIMRESRAKYMRDQGNPDDMGTQTRLDYDKAMERRNKAISDLEAQLK